MGKSILSTVFVLYLKGNSQVHSSSLGLAPSSINESVSSRQSIFYIMGYSRRFELLERDTGSPFVQLHSVEKVLYSKGSFV